MSQAFKKYGPMSPKITIIEYDYDAWKKRMENGKDYIVNVNIKDGEDDNNSSGITDYDPKIFGFGLQVPVRFVYLGCLIVSLLITTGQIWGLVWHKLGLSGNAFTFLDALLFPHGIALYKH